jgi:release factor glutamine methyltransferase
VTSLANALTEACAFLGESCLSPRADALLLLERATGRPRSWIVAYGETRVSSRTATQYRAMCERRRAGVPAAYIVNSAGFYGREFFVDESVLIPRPETEHLVDEAIAYIGKRALTVLDAGTGSGAIACAIAAETPARVYGTDVSEAALEVATENAGRLGVPDRCRFFQGDLAAPLAGLRFDVAIANLPYVPTAEIPKPPDPVSYEPRQALDGGPDGLGLYRRLLAALPALLNPNAMVLLEAAPPTISGLHALALSSLANFSISVHNDYAGLARYVKAQR